MSLTRIVWLSVSTSWVWQGQWCQNWQGWLHLPWGGWKWCRNPSIMFEMKMKWWDSDQEETIFLRKSWISDRRESCEYATLVTLEADSEILSYPGIVDVNRSKRRCMLSGLFLSSLCPWYLFCAMRLLTLKYKQELALIREILTSPPFEDKTTPFKVAFAKNYSASGKAIDEIERPSNGWKKSRNSWPHQKTNSASLTTADDFVKNWHGKSNHESNLMPWKEN